MFETKTVKEVVISRSLRWPNYGVSKCGRAFRWDTEKEMKVGMLTAGDYPVFRVSHQGKASWACIHYAIMDCWVVNPNPELYVEVNHKNGNKLDYSYDNLEWSTKSQNQRHALETGLRKVGGDLYNGTLSETLVHILCQELQDGCLPNDLAKKHDVSPHVVRKLRDGSTYFHIRSLYPIDHKFKNDFSESTVRWVCDRIVDGYADNKIAEMSTNDKITSIEVKRIRNKIRYRTISDDYF